MRKATLTQNQRHISASAVKQIACLCEETGIVWPHCCCISSWTTEGIALATFPASPALAGQITWDKEERKAVSPGFRSGKGLHSERELGYSENKNVNREK